MQLKLLEDFVCLAQTGSFVQAARLRHVTHPAFGRRITQLERWVGCALIQRDVKPVVLTEFGTQFLQMAQHLIAQLSQAQRSAQAQDYSAVSIVTGRTLARTLVADWLASAYASVNPAAVAPTNLTANKQANKKTSFVFDVQTASLESAAAILKGNRADFMVAYQHPSFDLKMDVALTESLRLSKDKLVAVSANRKIVSKNETTPWIAFAPQLALARLLQDQMPSMRELPKLKIAARCDSPDVAQSLVIRGLGVAWLPWSLVERDCNTGLLKVLGSEQWDIPFEVRIYRNKIKLKSEAEALWKFTKQYRDAAR